MLTTAAFAGFAACAGLIIAIGPQNAFVLRQGLQRRHVGLVVAICILGDITLTVSGVLGVGALVRQWPGLLQALRFGGAAFLALYGYFALRRAWRGSAGLAPTAGATASAGRVALACLAFTFLNPHVCLDTLVLLGGLSTRYAGAARWAFTLGAACCSVVWFSVLGYVARLLVPVFRRPAAWRVLDLITAAFMFGLALLLLARPIA